jgi:hypothetical protein
VTAVAAEADPYVLPVPAPDSPVVLPRWIGPGNPHPVSRYRDLTWSLAPLIDNPSTHLWKLCWKECPGQLRGPLRLAAWAMINGELRPTYLQPCGHQARAKPDADAGPRRHSGNCGTPQTRDRAEQMNLTGKLAAVSSQSSAPGGLTAGGHPRGTYRNASCSTMRQ